MLNLLFSKEPIFRETKENERVRMSKRLEQFPLPLPL